jgi:spore maturation protein CgeB
MVAALRDARHDAMLAQSLADVGLRAISERHTCKHRVRQLLAIVDDLRSNTLSTRLEAHEREVALS